MSDERLEYETNNPWWGEHVHRYNEALKYIPASSNVLDIACGNGYGTVLLSNQGHETIGGDISKETIDFCKKKFSNNRFELIDGTQIQFDDNSFDVVVSFETIEHTTEYSKMISEFKRILKQNGVAIISTPNILINSPTGQIVNKFHTQEWNYEELLSILSEHFSEVTIFGQEFARYRNSEGRTTNKFSKLIENLLYSRGVRKIPIKIQDKIMKAISGKTMYPLPEDYRLVQDVSRIKACRTFFAVCKP